MENPFITNLQTDPRIRNQISNLRTSKQLGLMWKAVAAAVKAESTNRRQLVLQYPDLAERVARVLGLSSPDKWNGRLPAATVPGKIDYVSNPSPILAQLQAIVAEAESRHQGQAAA